MSEAELVRAENQVDIEARNALVVEHRNLARWVGGMFEGRGLDRDDLDSAATVGLIRAAELFDPSRGIAFSTYAAYHCKAAVRRAIEKEARMVRVPHALEATMGRRHCGKLTDPPSDRELAAKRASSVGAVGGDQPPIECADEDPQPEAIAETNERVARLHEAIEGLELRQRYAVTRFYGIGCPSETQTEIATALGVSRTTIANWLRAAQGRLSGELRELE